MLAKERGYLGDDRNPGDTDHLILPLPIPDVPLTQRERCKAMPEQHLQYIYCSI